VIEVAGELDGNLAWLLETLWGSEEGPTVLDRPDEAASASYTIVPRGRRARAIVPTESVAARAALRAGAGTRQRRAQAGRSLAAWAVGSRMARPLFRDRLWLVGEDPLATTIAAALGEPVTLAAAVRPPGPFRKPVVQVLSADGRVIAYAKVAWNEVTGANVLAEHRALTALAERADGPVVAPRPLAVLEHRGFPVVLTEPMPSPLRRYDPDGGPPAPRVSQVVGEVLPVSAGDDPIGARLRDRFAAVDAPALAPVAEAAAELIAAIGDRARALPAGAWHGDWSSWNLGWQGDRLWAWDWEYCRTDVPVGLDIPHFTFQQQFIAERAPLADAFAAASAASAFALSSIGYDPAGRAIVHAVHTAEVALRYLEAETLGVDSNPRFTSDAVPVVRAALRAVG
jgi:hypothetical protein